MSLLKVSVPWGESTAGEREGWHAVSATRETRRPQSRAFRCMPPIAGRTAICRCKSVIPPSSGIRPTRVSGRPKLASSHATTMSQPSTISKPPPNAKPLTRARTGTSRLSRSAMPPNPPGRGAAQYSRPVLFPALFMSAPAQNARSPAPVSTTARTRSSASIAHQIRSRSCSVAGSTAFIDAGRSSVTRAT